ncbi:MAG TPA: hypothetical protein VMT86_22665 [Bryobacteraceae bacterium]|nr:hypothetical protein [Bryobacteraceae bacterium]
MSYRLAISMLAAALGVAQTPDYKPNGTPPNWIGYHQVKTDSGGRIVPWYGSGPSEAYDHVVRLAFGFWINMRKCPNGVPYYLQHQVWKADAGDPRGLGGDQIPMALSSWYLLYGYLGDPAPKDNMVLMADYWLAHGMSQPELLWASLPYPYNLEVHSGAYDGDMRAGKGFLQPDKAGSFGAELVVLYKMTGVRKYLNAAVRIADTLVARIQPGDGENSPWPFRVNAQTGAVHAAKDKSGRAVRASYTTNYAGVLRLFADLVAMKQGSGKAYAEASQTLAKWLKAYPLKTNKWGPFFEDIPTSDYSDTEINADTMAAYILNHPDWDPAWKQQAQGILHWSYATFANHEYEKWGVIPINEQTAYRVPGNSHTSRHASVELLYCEKTGDCASKEDAVRRLNWATYTMGNGGENRYIRDDIWLTDGYGDYVRHFLRAMASAPELAPDDQNHLLRTSSVLQSIQYGRSTIRYTKFDAVSTEEFKMGVWAPKSVTGGEMEWNASTKTLRVRSLAKTVVLQN